MLYPQNHSSLLHLITELSDLRHLISVHKHSKLALKMGITNHMVYPERKQMSPTTWVIWLFVCLCCLILLVFLLFFSFLKRLIKNNIFIASIKKMLALMQDYCMKVFTPLPPEKVRCLPGIFQHNSVEEAKAMLIYAS